MNGYRVSVERALASKTVRWLLPAASLLAALVLTRQAWIHARAQDLAESGWEQMRAGNLTGAIGTFLQAQDVASETFEASKGLGEAYFALWRLGPSLTLLDKAEAWYGKALLTMPADLTLRVRLLHLRALRNPTDAASLREALKLSEELAREHPGSFDLQERFLALVRDVTAVSGGKEQVSQDPQYLKTVVQAARLLLATGGFERVLRPLLEAGLYRPEELAPIVGEDARAAADLARYLLANGKWVAMREEFLRVSAKGGFHAVPVAVAKELRRAGRKEEAIALLKEFLRRRPDDPAAGYALAEIIYGPREEDWAAAEPLYRRAAETAVENFEYRRQYGIRLIERKEYGRAAAELRHVLAVRADDGWTLYNLGKASEGLGDYTEARKFYTRAVFLAPDNLAYRKALANLGGR